MNMRKLVAGIAAATAMLAGVALGVAPASAAETRVDSMSTVKFTADSAAQLAGRKLTAYKLADYYQIANDGDGGGVAYTVKTIADAATIHTALTDAVAATNANGLTVPDTKTDQLAWALSQNGVLDDSSATSAPWVGNTRRFAESLKSHINDPDFTNTRVNDISLTATNDESPSATITLESGVWLIVDTSTASDNVTQAIPMVVSTGKVTGSQLVSPDSPDTDPVVINFKNDTLTVSKSVDQQAVAVGQTVTYTLTSTVPSTTGYASTGYAYQFIDTLGAGLKYAGNVTVKVGGNMLSPAADGTGYAVNNPYENDAQEVRFDLSQYIYTAGQDSSLVGKAVVVTYDATVTDSAVVEGEGNLNTVILKYSNDPSMTSFGQPQSTVKVYTGKFVLDKLNKDGVRLSGAKFQVFRSGETGESNALQFVKNSEGTEYKLADGESGGTTTTTITTLDGAPVAITGLNGEYTVKETQAPAGYSSFLPAFNVTVTAPTSDGGASTVGVNPTQWGELVTSQGQTVTVTNVKNIAQLPLTGGVGLTLFVVATALFAGATVTLYAKSRKTRKELMR
ncbi:SpaH/EbpB family LPXTG-anchored major pilin [Bifidobacterium eulemuris]|uniref:SpaH/EbpB family LPXTG-anchored major pilin n=1 Tax=Bifidobacterium eulemuris TaxID=1765219 RepID=A0A261FXX1_9BIFI|nr:SpaH/EbpB family LPXTG-anchored major pilin [Bifidobacterium eulemuris]OZG64030.1 hypothetical protein BEUL_2232 [Bifidobacterium eulemuris]QOL32541.1 SpaH/EbpB family LPXTG-anchored major pilin [Bifidobacterium eulemuris]